MTLIACLCPTYRKPAVLVGTAVECFLRQTWPRKGLLVLDDAGEIRPQELTDWRIVSVPDRFPDMAGKYAAMVRLADEIWQPGAYAVWDDDDVFLPWHLEAAVKAMEAEHAHWSQPSESWSEGGGRLNLQQKGYHSAIVLDCYAMQAAGGWPRGTLRGFDQRFVGKLKRLFGPPADPRKFFPASYVYRWRSTGAYHLSAFPRRPDDTQWYGRIAEMVPPRGPDVEVVPALDEHAAKIYASLT